MNRARPLTVDVVLDVDGGSSRMETAAAIFLIVHKLRVHLLGSMGGSQ